VVHPVVKHCLVERVGADQVPRQVALDDPEGMQSALHGRGFAVADDPSSVAIRTRALRRPGGSSGCQATWNASTDAIFVECATRELPFR
jgi:hypothetical protein